MGNVLQFSFLFFFLEREIYYFSEGKRVKQRRALLGRASDESSVLYQKTTRLTRTLVTSNEQTNISGRSKTRPRRHSHLPFPLPAVAAAAAGTHLCRLRAPSIRAGNPNP
jgi:hypothetical protein